MLVTIEGPDKAGKTTQVKLLQEYATKHSKGWIFTRNPGGTQLGNRLREIVLDSGEIISDKSELMIYLADRAHHISQLIKPCLKEGKVVVCDRFIDSTVAYQGYGRGIDIDIINQMNNLVCEGIKPDLTILLMVSDKVAAERQSGPLDRFEKENKLFFIRVRNGYRSVARTDPLRFRIIDTDNLSIEEIHKSMIDLIENKIVEIHNYIQSISKNI